MPDNVAAVTTVHVDFLSTTAGVTTDELHMHPTSGQIECRKQAAGETDGMLLDQHKFSNIPLLSTAGCSWHLILLTGKRHAANPGATSQDNKVALVILLLLLVCPVNSCNHTQSCIKHQCGGTQVVALYRLQLMWV